MEYRIKNAEMEIVVSDLGAELISVVANGKERLWQNSTGKWSGHAPLLFPVAGRCAMMVNGVSYPIEMHGVARKSIFTLTSQTENALTFSLRANEKTREAYPFDFIFSVTYAMEKNKLTIVYEVENPSQETLYFGGGCHESYALDGDVGEYEVVFEKTENFTWTLHNDQGKLTGETLYLGEMQVLPLNREHLANSITYVFQNILSRSVILQEKNGKAIAKLSFPDYPNLMFWHAPESNYICIEPWLSLPDTVGKENIEFSQKPGIRALAPKSKTSLVHTIEYL